MTGRKLFSPTVLLLSFVLVHSVHLGRTVQYDEAFTYLFYTRTPLHALFLYTLPNNHLLHSAFVWASKTLIGDFLLAIRFPAFAAGMLAIAMLYRTGRRIAGPSAGLLAAAWLGVTPAFAEFVTNGRGYTLSIVLSLVLFNLAYDLPAPQRASRKHQAALLGVSWLLVITLPTMLLLIAALVLWKLLAPETRDKRAWLYVYSLPVIFGVMAGVVFYSYGFIIGGLSSHASTFGYDSLAQLLSDFVLGIFDSPPGIGLALALPVGGWAAWRTQPGYLAFVFIAAGVALALAVAQWAVTGNVMYPRVYIYLVPFIVLVGALGLQALLQALRWQSGALIVALVIVSVGGWSLRGLSNPTEVDDLSRAIDSHAKPGDVLLIDCCLDVPMRYLYRHDPFSFDLTDDRRVVMIPTRDDSRPRIERMYHVPPGLPCTPTRWDTFDVLVCPPVTR